MPFIRTYHGLMGEKLHKVTDEEYAELVARYEDLKARANAAYADLWGAPSEDLAAAREAFELAYKLDREEDMDVLKNAFNACDEESRRRNYEAAQRRADAQRAVDNVVKAIEAAGKALESLQNIPRPEDLPPVTLPAPIDPAYLEGADLARERIVPTSDHGSHMHYEGRLKTCLSVLKVGIPTDTRKKAEALLTALLERTAEADAVVVANLKAIDAEQRRRDEERQRQEKAKEEAAHLPEIVADLRERIAQLEGKAKV